MNALNVSAITFQSADPARLAEFYRDAIGLPLRLDRHGPVAPHHEGDLEGVHLAVLQAQPAAGGPVVPVFRVADLAASISELQARGVDPVHAPINLGDGMSVAGFRDPDGNVFRLIEIPARR